MGFGWVQVPLWNKWFQWHTLLNRMWQKWFHANFSLSLYEERQVPQGTASSTSSFLEVSLLRSLSHCVRCLATLLKGPCGETTWRRREDWLTQHLGQPLDDSSPYLYLNALHERSPSKTSSWTQSTTEPQGITKQWLFSRPCFGGGLLCSDKQQKTISLLERLAGIPVFVLPSSQPPRPNMVKSGPRESSCYWPFWAGWLVFGTSTGRGCTCCQIPAPSFQMTHKTKFPWGWRPKQGDCLDPQLHLHVLAQRSR